MIVGVTGQSSTVVIHPPCAPVRACHDVSFPLVYIRLLSISVCCECWQHHRHPASHTNTLRMWLCDFADTSHILPNRCSLDERVRNDGQIWCTYGWLDHRVDCCCCSGRKNDCSSDDKSIRSFIICLCVWLCVILLKRCWWLLWQSSQTQPTTEMAVTLYHY